VRSVRAWRREAIGSALNDAAGGTAFRVAGEERIYFSSPAGWPEDGYVPGSPPERPYFPLPIQSERTMSSMPTLPSLCIFAVLREIAIRGADGAEADDFTETRTPS